MSIKKTLNFSLPALMITLAGCATEFQDYNGTATRAAMANICYKEGYINHREFSSYTTFQLNSYPSQWRVDKARLKREYYTNLENWSSVNWDTKKDWLLVECAEISTVARRVSR